MDEFIDNAGEKIEVVTGAVSAGAAWVATKFEWWKNSESKLVKIGVPLGVFLVFAIVLSILT